MKTIKYAVAAIALSTLSFGAFAAEPVSASQAAAGASAYNITSAVGNDKMSGTAVIYK